MEVMRITNLNNLQYFNILVLDLDFGALLLFKFNKIKFLRNCWVVIHIPEEQYLSKIASLPPKKLLKMRFFLT